jgi:DNA-binding NarL/FixJ family response regulator
MNPVSQKSISVLIAEDSVIVRARLRALLAEERLIEVVEEAEEAEEAIRKFELSEPDAVVLDLQLRRGTGLEVLRHIRRTGSRCLTIMLTNHAHAEFRDLCQQHGADYFFHKSTEFEKVAEVLAASAAAGTDDSSPGRSNP